MTSIDRVRLNVAYIPASKVQPVVTVKETDELDRARTLMEVHDFSQLPVVRGRGTRPIGVVSWATIGRALLRNSKAALIDCIDVSIKSVPLDSDLLEAIPVINRDGYVLVVNPEGDISGIVTSADLGDALADLAGPFLSVAECERMMRDLIADCLARAHLDVERVTLILKMAEPFDGNVAGLAFGELVTLLVTPDVWALLEGGYERNVMADQLNQVSEIRNRIMHFRDLEEEQRETADPELVKADETSGSLGG
ncbi:HPP family protein [Cryobacterium sp. Y29]|uniref:CBS domain-containing protein n=1 Tax=Cryobacterium sp. Y29 TaxID=2048285 RepID=UPI000CE46F14|nr:CBS domain-containing protein [Cryobacterium sp. Y29]